MKLYTMGDLSFKGKRILIRADFNIPLDEHGRIVDDSRIRASLPTINYALNSGGAVILMSHLGKPDGKRVEELSLAPVAKKLSALLKTEVTLAPDCIGDVVERMASKLPPGHVLLLENLRFHPGEEDPDHHPQFVQKLSRIGDVYIDDAFGTAHRKHASNYAIVPHFANKAAGLLIEKEVLVLSQLLHQAQSPFHAIIGGSKISSKIGVLETLIDIIDALYIGGGMAFTFLQTLGIPIGNSLFDEHNIEMAKQVMKLCKTRGVELYLPSDFIITENLSNDASVKIADTEGGIPTGWIGADIGPKTISDWKTHLKNAKTIFWNGPLGIFEMTPFQKGTTEIIQSMASSKAMTIVGGGDSVSAINQLRMEKKFTHISTGGGASLEFLESKTLPALEVLSRG